MATRQPHLSESINLGLGTDGLIIECDECGRVIDAIHGFWRDEFEDGLIYAGEVLCWRCKEKKEEASNDDE